MQFGNRGAVRHASRLRHRRRDSFFSSFVGEPADALKVGDQFQAEMAKVQGCRPRSFPCAWSTKSNITSPVKAVARGFFAAKKLKARKTKPAVTVQPWRNPGAELVVNLKVAKTLGITRPHTQFLRLPYEVIE